MPATAVSTTIAQVREFLVEARARFWTDAELSAIYALGVSDLWGGILDLHGEHYMVVDETHVVLKSGAKQLTGVPEDCFRVLLIEPRDTTTSGSGRGIIFTPRKYNHADFKAARSRTSLDPSGIDAVYYHVSGVGAPISAPTILTAPVLTADLLLRFVYCPTITVDEHNPIPGQSDNALKAWTISYALGKQASSGAQVPDAGWLAIYATEKQSILTRLTPRQEQEPEVVDDFFAGML